MIKTRFAKLIAGLIKIAVISSFVAVPTLLSAMQQDTLSLVGNRVATLIDTEGNPARANDAILKAFSEKTVTVTATTQAWSGSGLRNGKFQGYIDHYSLNQEKPNYVYSQPYASVKLHIASTYEKVVDMKKIEKLYRQRVGIENRFANTDQMRGERSVSWARAPDFLGNIQQLAGQRVDYILADKYMLDEFNKLLLAIDEEPLYLSASPVFSVDLKLGINQNVSGAAAIIEKFNESVTELKAGDEYLSIFESDDNENSSLDITLYEDILQKW